jgi:hypothetical protein
MSDDPNEALSKRAILKAKSRAVPVRPRFLAVPGILRGLKLAD